jgi:hypothetical protein
MITTPTQQAYQNLRGSALYFLLPFIEQDNLYRQGQTGANNPNPVGANIQTWLGAVPGAPTPNNQVGSQVVKTFIAPADSSTSNGRHGTFGTALTAGARWAVSNYAINAQVLGTAQVLQTASPWGAQLAALPGGLNGSARIPATFQDGTSLTIVFAEKYGTCNTTNTTFSQGTGTLWAHPGGPQAITSTANNGEPRRNDWGPYFAQWSFVSTNPLTKFQVSPTVALCQNFNVQSFSAGGIQVGLGDGSCRNVSPGINALTWWLAIRPDDGQVMPSDWNV